MKGIYSSIYIASARSNWRALHKSAEVLVMLRSSLTPQSIPGSRVKVIFADDALSELGAAARSLGGTRILLVTDPGIRDAGHEERAVRSLYKSNLVLRVFDDVEENPTALVVEKALRAAREFRPDLIVGLGGGSS